MASSPLFIVSEGEDFEVVAQSRLDRSVRKSLIKFDGTLQKAIVPSGGLMVGNGADAHLVGGHYHVDAMIAKSANAAAATLYADASITNGNKVVAAQPDVPRKLLVFITDANSSITAGTVTLTGLDATGATVREVIDISNGGTKTYKTANAFAVLSTLVVAGLVGNAGADHLAVGVDSALGLPIPAGAVVTVSKEAVVAAPTVSPLPVDETVGTVDQVARSVDPTTAPDGTKGLHFWFGWTW